MISRRLRRPITIAFMLVTLLLTSIGATAQSLDPAMTALWERTDRPVANQEVNRSWLWGPQANHILYEPYTFAPLEGGQRLVAYYDKSRMEINNPGGDPAEVWYVTNGRLVWEMMVGQVQTGQDPDRFDSAMPATIPVAGDIDSQSTPTYQGLGNHLASASDQTGQFVTATIDQSGTTGQNQSPIENRQLVQYVTYEGGDGEVGHNVPDVFWDFLTQDIDPLVAPANWVFVMGYPLTEPYWTKSTVGGVELDVMLQCFERRCLTYTPTNNDPFKVEMGNVGIHYYMWRYGADSDACPVPIGDTVPDDLIIPAGAVCTLEGTTVEGNIEVKADAVLHAHNVLVDGNIQAENAREVNVYEGSRIEGNIQVEQGHSATVRGAFVDGDIQLEQNGGPLVVTDNQVGGNIQVFENSGGAEISRNTVDGNLQCQANQPPPTGGENVVAGDKEDQCAGL